jgi:hypothetical protein
MGINLNINENDIFKINIKTVIIKKLKKNEKNEEVMWAWPIKKVPVCGSCFF